MTTPPPAAALVGAMLEDDGLLAEWGVRRYGPAGIRSEAGRRAAALLQRRELGALHQVLLARCVCGCPLDAHVGDVGCPCGPPGEPPCDPPSLRSLDADLGAVRVSPRDDALWLWCSRCNILLAPVEALDEFGVLLLMVLKHVNAPGHAAAMAAGPQTPSPSPQHDPGAPTGAAGHTEGRHHP